MLGRPGKDDTRSAVPVSPDLDIGPAHSLSQTASEGLDERLLCRESSGEALVASLTGLAFLSLTCSKQPLSRLLRPVTQQSLNPHHLHLVDSDSEYHPRFTFSPGA